MDKNIKEHANFIAQKINYLEDELTKATDKTLIRQKICDLNNYHKTMVKNFQHERHIHLLVTLFFAALMIVLAGASIILSVICSADAAYSVISILVTIIFTVIFIVEIFYIIHYFKLENGTQKLYILSKKLFDLLNK